MHIFIFIESGISIKLVRFIKLCSNETYHKVLIDKHLSDTLPIQNGLKQGDAWLTLLFDFVFEQAIKKFRANQEVVKLNVTHQLVVCADLCYFLGKYTHSTKKTQELY